MSETITRNDRRVLRGTVVSNRMDKTITVRVERKYKHAKYGKFVRRHKSYHAHDEENQAQVGDFVEIASTRPLSKLKRWRLLQVLESAALPESAKSSADDAEAVTTEIREAAAAAAPSAQAAAQEAADSEEEGGEQQ